MKTEKGSIGWNEKKVLGLITSKTAAGWKGITLTGTKFGKPWISKDPKIIGTFDKNNGHLKFPVKTKVVDLGHSLIVKTVQAHNFDLFQKELLMEENDQDSQV